MRVITEIRVNKFSLLQNKLVWFYLNKNRYCSNLVLYFLVVILGNLVISNLDKYFCNNNAIIWDITVKNAKIEWKHSDTSRCGNYALI